jgi:uncharacterized protein YndB with AHSA1/START domain
MLKKVGIALVVLVVLVAGFAGFVALQPADYHVERSARIAAPPADVFAEVNDFHRWEAWSPWAKLDPQASNSYEGPAAGEGAVVRWSGNSDVGEGSMTLTESRPHERIRIRLDFVRPFEDTCTVEFVFKPDGDQTVVAWSMFGQNNFLGKAMCLFMNMDRMVGDKFDEGLASMKTVVESRNAGVQ